MSSEKGDMGCPFGTHQPVATIPQEECPTEHAKPNPVSRFRLCVWSGPDGERRCGEGISEAVVTGIWRRELDVDTAHEDRFFNFIWQGEVWRAFGLSDGRVRGIFCPSHNEQRAERIFCAKPTHPAPLAPSRPALAAAA